MTFTDNKAYKTRVQDALIRLETGESTAEIRAEHGRIVIEEAQKILRMRQENRGDEYTKYYLGQFTSATTSAV